MPFRMHELALSCICVRYARVEPLATQPSAQAAGFFSNATAQLNMRDVAPPEVHIGAF